MQPKQHLSLANEPAPRIPLLALESDDQLGVLAGDMVILDAVSGRAWLVREIATTDPFAVRRAAGDGILQPVTPPAAVPSPSRRRSLASRRRTPRDSR